MELLIKDTEQMRQAVSDLPNTLEYKVIKGDLQRSQDRYMPDILGTALLTLLVADFEDSEASASASSSSSTAFTQYSEEQFNELKRLCQKAITHLALSMYILRGYAQLGPNSLTQKRSDTMTPLTYFERQELSQEYLERGLEDIDEVYSYLQTNRMNFQEWVASPAYSTFHQFFIKSADEFQKEVDIHGSARTFKHMRASMKYLEQITLPAVLSDELIAELRSETSKADPNAAHLTALGYLKSYLAHATVVRFMESHRVKIDRHAIIQIETAGDFIDKKYQADRADINTSKAFHEHEADEWMNKLRTYLNANASEFDNWTAEDSSTWSRSDIANSTGKTLGL